MAEPPLNIQFQQSPLDFLDIRFRDSGGIVQTGVNEFCLGNPIEARSVLRNHDGLYEDHSDFFHIRSGMFGPLSAQQKIRRQSRALLHDHLEANGLDKLSAFVSTQLSQVSEWPDTGNRLMYRYLLPVLVAEDSPPQLRALLDEIVERAVLAGARSRQCTWRRMLLQFRTTLLLSQAIETRQRLARSQPIDLLDVVAGAAEHGQKPAELAEVFLSFLFAIAGSVGFVLGWSIYLWGTHPECEAPPECVVQEALRLWPVAWQLSRRPIHAHKVSGIKVSAADEVVVCPYLVHRNPEYWKEPSSFRPDRWSDSESWHNPAFIPFGYGPHRCVAGEMSSRLVSDVLRIMVRSNELLVTSVTGRPTIDAAIAPPQFRLTLRPRS